MAVSRVKQFPPGRAGVLLPMGDKRTAALGICLYTVSRPGVLRVQRAAFRLTRRLGARGLPGPSMSWTPGLDEWEDLLRTWRKELGLFDGLAVYQRRQQSRTGLTILLTRQGTPMAVTKIRDQWVPLDVEQRALDAIRQAQVSTFRVPEALGMATLDSGLAWSAQTAVFDAPHRPAFTVPTALFDEVRDALRSVVPATSGQSAGHNDLTPWNLRVDRHGRMWLFDWEDVGPAPAGSDECYFWITSHALNRTAIPTGLTAASIEHWSRVVTARPAHSTADSKLKAAILGALDIADRVRHEQELDVEMTW